MPRAAKARVVVDYGAGVTRRFCAECGAGIDHRPPTAVYCEPGTVCARRRDAARERMRRARDPEHVRAIDRASYRRRLARDPELRARLTAAGRARIEPYRADYLAMQAAKQRLRRRKARREASA